MKKEKIFCWTHGDLDGVVSALAVMWYHPDADIEVMSSTVNRFRSDYTQWLLHHKPSDYDKIYVTDLDVAEDADLIDEDNFVIIDHHSTHDENQNYQHATAHIEVYSSAARLCYDIFKEQDPGFQLTNEQKMLIVLADDHDSHNNEVPESRKLNSIFWETQKGFDVFLDIYYDGFKGFTPAQDAMFRISEQKLESVLSNLTYFVGKEIPIGKHKCFIISTFADSHINDVADHIIETYGADVAIIVNTGSEHVSFRRSEDSLVHLGRLAELIAEGGGHAAAAGGKITPRFLEFTKLLKPRKRIKKVEQDA